MNDYMTTPEDRRALWKCGIALAVIVAGVTWAGSARSEISQRETAAPVTVPQHRAAKKQRSSHHLTRTSRVGALKRYAPRSTRRTEYASAGAVMLPHPAGCPRSAFCACGAAIKVFGHNIRSLWPSSAWMQMPPAAPGHMKVMARYGHVAVIDYMIDARTAMVWDYNSGGGKSRYHPRRLAGFKIVDPLASRFAGLAI